MVHMNVLVHALKTINNAKREESSRFLLGHTPVTVRFPAVTMNHGYTGEFEMTESQGWENCSGPHRQVKHGRTISLRFDVN